MIALRLSSVGSLLMLVSMMLVGSSSAGAVMFSDDFDVPGLDPNWTIGAGMYDVNAGVLFESTLTPYTETQLFWDGGLTDTPDQFGKLQVVTHASHTWGFMFRTDDVSGHHYEVHLPPGGVDWRWEINNPSFVGLVDGCVGDFAIQDGDWLGATVVGTGANVVVSVWRWDTDPDLGATPDPDANWGPPDCTMSADPSVTSEGRGVGIRSYTGSASGSALADNWIAGDRPLGVCGNSIIEAFEDCDDGMETASCNADCTFAVCGDDYFNPLAETCEFDANCAGGEICTSACACIVTPVCGNNILEYGEECDEGGQTATCDSDCTVPVCGDGIINAGAGEACEVDMDCLGAGEVCTNSCLCEVPNGQLFSDDFMTGPGLPNWTVMNGSFDSVGGVLVESTSSTFQTTQLRWDAGLTDTSDQFAKLQLIDPGARSWGFMFRLDDTSLHHYEVHLPANTIQWRWELYDPTFVGPVGSCLGDVAVDPGDWIGAAVEGVGANTRISVWRWDSDPDAAAPADPAANWGTPDCQMLVDPSVDVDDGRALGVRSFTSSSSNPSSVDNFAGGDLLNPIAPIVPGNIVRILSSHGAGTPNSMIDPDGIAVDSMDNVYVAACGLGPTTEGVFKVEPNGTVTQVMDTTGDGFSPANCPVGIDIDSMDNVYVSTLLSDNVFRIAANGTVTEVLDASGDGVTALSGPLGVNVGADDTVYVAGHFSDNVFALPPAGGVQVILDATGGGTGTPLDAPFGVTSDLSGNVFVAGFGPGSDAVFKIAPGGATSIVLDATGDGAGNVLEAPHCLVTDASGVLFVTGNRSDNVFSVTPGGVVSVILDASGDGAGNLMDNPTSITVDDMGNVFVAAFGTDNGFWVPPAGPPVQIIDRGGDGTTAYGAPSDFVMALDSMGNIYTAGIVEDAVFRISPVPEPGTLLQLIAGAGLLTLLGRRRPGVQPPRFR